MALIKSSLRFIYKNALISALAAGIVGYETFAHIPFLEPVGNTIGPWFTEWLPIGMFLLLYFTFCKIRISELRPRTWHFVIQLIRTMLSASIVLLIIIFAGNAEVKLVLEGLFICFICPTAAAVVVVAEKLGGNIGSLTIFTIIANVVTMIIIPLFFPMVEREADISFYHAMLLLLRNVTIVLVLPLALAQLSRLYFPRMVSKFNRHKNIAFYIWCANLIIVTGLTIRNIEASTVSGSVLCLLLILPLFACLAQFAIGKEVGRHWDDSINAGQALGQKNTVVGIWLTLTYLNPLAAVAPGAYILWQNLVNGWQLWYKERYGTLKW